MTQAKKSPDGDMDSVAIFLTGDHSTDPVVAHIEFRRDDYANRLTFRRERRLNEVFSAEFVNALRAVLDGFDRGASSRYLPECTVTLPNVILRRLKLMRVQDHGGDAFTVIRFERHFGDLNDLLLDDLSLGWRPHAPVDDVALEVLTDIAMPLLDLTERVGAPQGLAEVDHNADLASRLAALNRTRAEILMNLDLLKRFVLSASQTGASPPLVRSSPEPGPRAGRRPDA